ncbi:flagellar type III secretion system protein FlhB [Hylemonella gracilis]|uniref:Flagellar biosynthetic protein FlhB n=1 Tax=Hylemonella gracilis TaxID=80880 RepID=A0A4P6UJ18_9BURK|nr:flagellar type III secretion system protein FlhB [Hylemonella gracilis]QBK04090.1 flagellar type III secretion system protein FlhB [Hylemonella gracilis]
MESSSQDRNLPASQRKLQRARDDGQVPRSRDFSHLAVLGGGAVTLVMVAPWIYEALRESLARHLSLSASDVRDPGFMLDHLHTMVLTGAGISLGVAVIIVAIAVLSTLAGGGWVWTTKPLAPDFSRVNPLKGLQGLFTKKKLADVIKLAFIAFFVLTLAAVFIYYTLPSVATLVLQPSTAGIERMLNWLVMGCSLLLGVILLVALIDLPLQIFLHKSELKMSLQEMKDEHKDTDGNPQMKSRRRQKQRELAQRQSLPKVPQADFVLMNPTHYAVAVKYEEKSMAAPRVVSKGADLLAMKIRDLAKAHQVPVIQSPVLARALFAHAELDQDIPSTLYTAVAQVLAYVYRLKAALQGRGQMPGDMPQPVVPPGMDPHDSRAAQAAYAASVAAKAKAASAKAPGDATGVARTESISSVRAT